MSKPQILLTEVSINSSFSIIQNGDDSPSKAVMIEESSTSGVIGVEADMANPHVAPISKAEASSTPVRAQTAFTSDDLPVTDSSNDEDDSITRYPGLASLYIVGWAISREAVMKALNITDTEDLRVEENIYEFARDYVEPIDKWDLRTGGYLKDGDRENLKIEYETVIVADGAQMPEKLEARLDEWKEFPEELWQIHKWMKGPHVFKNLT